MENRIGNLTVRDEKTITLKIIIEIFFKKLPPKKFAKQNSQIPNSQTKFPKIGFN